MAKDKRRRKSLSFLNLKFSKISKAIFIIIVIIVAFFIFKRVTLLIKKIPYFKVNELVVIEDGQSTQSYIQEFIDVRGENIFEVDLLKLSQRIQQGHPEFHTLRVARELPDKLVIELQRRKTIACVKLDKYYPVDIEGFILPAGKNFPFSDLPIINLPLAIRSKTIESGKRCDLDELKTSLTLLKQFSDSSGLKRHKIIAITVNSAEDISFLMDNKLEIRVAKDDLKEKLRLLSGLLPEVTAQGEVKYIDLRFKDPIIKPK